jgi:Ca2+-binding RTX toxin-like protein
VEGSSTPIMKDSTSMVNGSTPLIHDNKLKFTILALCLAVFTISIANCLPEALAIPDIFDTTTESLKALDTGDNVLTCPPISCTGTPQNDIMIGTAVGDTMFGLEGNDNIQGNGDADVIYGGDGGDNIQGGEGSDTIFGQDGNDFLFGDSGTNLVFGGGGNALYGGKGDDHLYGGSDSDVLDGGPGHDVFDCGEGVDRIVGFDPKEDSASTNCEILG